MKKKDEHQMQPTESGLQLPPHEVAPLQFLQPRPAIIYGNFTLFFRCVSVFLRFFVSLSLCLAPALLDTSQFGHNFAQRHGDELTADSLCPGAAAC